MSILIYNIDCEPQVKITKGIQLDQQGPIMLNATQSKFIMSPGVTHLITVAGVLDGSTASFWNASASVSGSLIDCNGNPVAECNAIPIPYINNSNGVFQASFGDFNFQPALGTQYTLILDGIQNGVTFHIEALVEVVIRTS